MKKFTYNLFMLMIGIFLIGTIGMARPINTQGGQKSKSVTNDDFSNVAPSRDTSSADDDASPPKSGKSSRSKRDGGGHVMSAPKLQFRLLDLQLQSAGDPENRSIRDDMIRVKSQIADAKPEPVDDTDWRDLEFKKRYVALKVKLIDAQKEADFAGTNIQLERRKVKKGTRSTNKLQKVRKAQGEAADASDKVEEIQAEIDALVEEGKLAGAGSRAFH